MGELPVQPVSTDIEKGVRARSGQIILAREADEVGAPTSADTTDLNKNEARVTVPLSDVLTENAMAGTALTEDNVRQGLVTYDYLTYRTRTEAVRRPTAPPKRCRSRRSRAATPARSARRCSN